MLVQEYSKVYQVFPPQTGRFCGIQYFAIAIPMLHKGVFLTLVTLFHRTKPSKQDFWSNSILADVWYTTFFQSTSEYMFVYSRVHVVRRVIASDETSVYD